MIVHARVQESIAFNKAASLDTHKALVHIFFAQRATKKVFCSPTSASPGLLQDCSPGCLHGFLPQRLFRSSSAWK